MQSPLGLWSPAAQSGAHPADSQGLLSEALCQGPHPHPHCHPTPTRDPLTPALGRAIQERCGAEQLLL